MSLILKLLQTSLTLHTTYKRSSLFYYTKVINEEKKFIALTLNPDKHSGLLCLKEVSNEEKSFISLTINLDKHSSLLCLKEVSNEKKVLYR
jgi:hypothetical protein